MKVDIAVHVVLSLIMKDRVFSGVGVLPIRIQANSLSAKLNDCNRILCALPCLCGRGKSCALDCNVFLSYNSML